jgi:hypothetical protein
VLEPADKKIRILLLDDHTSFRQDLVKLLSTQPDLDLPVDAFPKRPKALTAREIECFGYLSRVTQINRSHMSWAARNRR